MPDSSTAPLIAPVISTDPRGTDSSSRSIDSRTAWRSHMADGTRARRSAVHPRHTSIWVVASSVVDWLLIVATGIGGLFLGNVTPNKRPFQLENPDISFPYTLHETVTSRNLVIATIAVPVVVIIVSSLVLVPGLSTPSGVPRPLIWRRKLWELHASLLSYALGMVSQWFIINGLKNLCGKPRPDLLARCQPDLQNVAQYVVGGIANITSNGQLVSAAICTNTDTSVLNDGFRSYPSGHSSSSAAGLGYLAVFLAFKFGVVFPFVRVPLSRDATALSISAFPSRSTARPYPEGQYELDDISRPGMLHDDGPSTASAETPLGAESQPSRLLDHAPVSSRRAGAAPPLYLLVIVLAPLFGSVFIAASRWFDYRHHGFDILFGYAIGAITALVAFRLYQLPMSHGAGWAWGPRSPDKAFWAGVGSNSWAEPWEQWTLRTHDDESAYGFEPRSTATSKVPLSRRPTASRRTIANNGAGDIDTGYALD